MKTLIATALAAASLAVASAAPAEAKSNKFQVKIEKIMDPTGFEKPMTAATLLLPADWKSEGGVIYDMNDQCLVAPKVNWMAKSPDGKSAIAYLPNFAWAQNNMGYPNPQGCLSAGFGNAEQVAQYMVGRLPQGRVTGNEKDPKVMRMFAPFNTEIPGDPYMKYWFDMTETRFTFREGGIEYEGIMSVLTIHTYMQSGQSMVYMTGMPPMETLTGNTLVVTAYTAPKGEFNEGIYRLAMTNYRVDPEWNRRNMQVMAKTRKVSMEEARKRSQIISDTYSDISDMSMDSWKRRQASSDYSQRETSEMIRGVETYNADTPTGQIELPSGYDSAWQLNDGTFVVTDDTFYDPWRDSGQEGTRLGVAD